MERKEILETYYSGWKEDDRLLSRFGQVEFLTTIRLIEKYLKPGMKMAGVVRNVIDFGAFVDIGVHQDGLVHISQICSKYIKHPSEVLSVGDRVTVTVLAVDKDKGRISLTMKDGSSKEGKSK